MPLILGASMIYTSKFDFAVHFCTVWLIEKPEAVSCQLLAGVLLDFIWLSIQPCKSDFVSVALWAFDLQPAGTELHDLDHHQLTY